MFKWPFGKKDHNRLGIDLGTSAIKIVELSKKDERISLVNYALAQNKEGAVFKINDLKDEEVAEIIKALLKEAKISSRQASISLSTDKTFATVIDFPVMPEKELMTALPFEAQKYVPLPIEEVTLDWSIIPEAPAAQGAKKTGIQVLLIAVPKEFVNKIMKIAKLAGIEVMALEQEAFSVARSLIGNDKSAYMILDLGKKNTDLIIVDNGFIRMSHNLETGTKEFVLMEIDRIVNVYQMRYNKKVGQCLLTGGRAGEKEFTEFLAGKLKIPVRVGYPFARVAHDQKLEGFLKELGPQLAIATGLAMRD